MPHHCCGSSCHKRHACRQDRHVQSTNLSSSHSTCSTVSSSASKSISSLLSASASYNSGSKSSKSSGSIKSHKGELHKGLPVLPLCAAEYENPQPFGRVFNVVEADLDDGEETVTVRWLRRGHYCDHDHLSVAMEAAKKTEEVVASFLRCVNTCGWTIHVQQPRLARTRPFDARPLGTEALFERSLGLVYRYNTNSGWHRDTKSNHARYKTPNHLLQALSHFSFAWSKHKLAVCNLRAHVNHSKKEIIICMPTIMTTVGGVYGCEDLGMKGLQNFFKWHPCNQFCCGYAVPKHCAAFYEPVCDTLVNKDL